jgi:hypothetical protein
MVESPFNPIQMVEAYSEDDTPLPAGVNPSHYQHHRRHHRDHFDYDDVDEAEFEEGYKYKSKFFNLSFGLRLRISLLF